MSNQASEDEVTKLLENYGLALATDGKSGTNKQDSAAAVLALIKQYELQARIDELYHVKPIVHRMGLITYAPRMVTLESIALRITELKQELEKL